MEFKGTQGKWIVKHLDEIFIENEKKKDVCLIPANGIYDYNEWRQNALLISKSPEMLDMLKELVELSSVFENEGEPTETFYQTINKAEKLIKEATELNHE